MDTTPESDTSPADESRWGRVAGTVTALLSVGLAVWLLPVEQALRQFLAWMEGIGIWGGIAFVGLYIVGTIAFLPGAILTLGAGYAFGVVWGLVLVSIASTVGAALAFVIGRYVARDWVRSKIASRPKFRALDRALEKDAFKVVGLVRLVPILPFNALNYGFGVSGVGFWPYVLGSWLGMLPGTLMYVYFGSLAEKATRLAAGTPERQVAIWEVGETLQRLMAGNFGGGVLQNLLYWLGLVATVAVATLITRRARAELHRLTEGEDPSETTAPGEPSNDEPTQLE